MTMAPGGFWAPSVATSTIIADKQGLQVDTKMTIRGIDVGHTLEVVLFFLQSRHPEVFDEFNAIQKIKES